MGSVPISAAIVVIMIGRKRMRQASKIACAGADVRRLRCAVEREVDHHDRVLLDDADQHDDADEGVQVEVDVEQQQREQRAEPGRRQAGENRQRVP
jgi:hypothetical protein